LEVDEGVHPWRLLEVESGAAREAGLLVVAATEAGLKIRVASDAMRSLWLLQKMQALLLPLNGGLWWLS
jgi:hypothetical protein